MSGQGHCHRLTDARWKSGAILNAAFDSSKHTLIASSRPGVRSRIRKNDRRGITIWQRNVSFAELMSLAIWLHSTVRLYMLSSVEVGFRRNTGKKQGSTVNPPNSNYHRDHRSLPSVNRRKSQLKRVHWVRYFWWIVTENGWQKLYFLKSCSFIFA